LQQLVIPNIVFVLALGLAKGYLLFSNADVLWLTFRVFACGTIVVIGRTFVAERWKQESVEVRYTVTTSAFRTHHNVVAGGGLRVIFVMSPDGVALCCFGPYTHCPVSRPHKPQTIINQRAISVVVLTHFSSLWMKSLMNISNV
jgi:hypothetical protein